MSAKDFKINRKKSASTNTIRKGWAKAFEEMHKAGDDKLLITDVFEDETFEHWKFKKCKKIIKQTFVD